jgi:hypothetical protein
MSLFESDRIWTYRFEDDRIVLSGAIPIDEIDPLDAAMLTHNQVPHMIPLSMRNLDRTVELDFLIGPRKPLSEWLRIHQITEDGVLHFLLHVVNHLEQLRDHLLIPNRCPLSPDMIFVGDHLLDARFIYWPNEAKEENEQETASALQQLCVRLAKYRQDMRAIRGIMTVLEDPLFSLHRLRKRIINLTDRLAQPEAAVSSAPERKQADIRQKVRRWLKFSRHRQEPEHIPIPSVRPEVISRYTVPLNSRQEKGAEASLLVRHADREEEVRIHRTPFLIGRDPQTADWMCDDARLSRLHAEIKRSINGYVVRDLGSRNGTYVNGERIVPYTDVHLRPDDEITFAGLRCKFMQSS